MTARTLTAPPPNPVEWRFTHRATGSSCVVVAQTWYVARALACARLGAAPEEVEGVVVP